LKLHSCSAKMRNNRQWNDYSFQIMTNFAAAKNITTWAF
jgi:hypothetical protein